MARWRVMSGAVRIVGAYWDRFLAVEPLFATAVGDARFGDLVQSRGVHTSGESQSVS
jgi:hypothetical protein